MAVLFIFFFDFNINTKKKKKINNNEGFRIKIRRRKKKNKSGYSVYLHIIRKIHRQRNYFVNAKDLHFNYLKQSDV